MEPSEISEHQLRVFLFVQATDRWLTSNEIAVGAQVAPRTARSHALRLSKLGIFDAAEVFPGHRYKFSEMASKRNSAYMMRLEKAREILGL